MRLWRRPESSTPAAATSAAYLRLMARSRALDLWREHAGERSRDGPPEDRRRPRRGPPRRISRSRAERDDERAQRARRPRRPARPQREAVVLAYWGGLTADEIATPLGRSARDGEEPRAARAGQLRMQGESSQGPGGRDRSLSGPAPRCPSTERPSTPGWTASTATGATCWATPSGSTPTRTSARTTPTGARRPPEEIIGGLDQAGHQARCLRHARARRLRPGQRRRARGDRGLGRPARSARARQPAPRGRRRRGEALPRRGRARVQAPPALGRVRPPAPGGRRDRRARGRAAHARAVPRRPRHPAPRRGGRRPRAPLPGRPAHPRPRGDQRPRLDRPRRRRAAQPVLRHRVVARLRPPPALRDDPARPDPLRERHAVRAGPDDAFIFLRVARAVGLGGDAMRAIAGGQLDRIMAGDDPLDLGPAPGRASVGPRVIDAERVVAYCATALQLSFRGIDPTESIALARLACRTGRDDDTGRCSSLRRPAARDRAREPRATSRSRRAAPTPRSCSR